MDGRGTELMPAESLLSKDRDASGVPAVGVQSREGRIIRPGESEETKPGENEETKPGENGETKPGESGETKPGESGETKPGESGETQPGESEATKPEESGETKPGENEETKPGESGETKPGESEETKPEESEATQPEETEQESGAGEEEITVSSNGETLVPGDNTSGTMQQSLPIIAGIAIVLLLLLAWLWIGGKQKKGKKTMEEEITEEHSVQPAQTAETDVQKEWAAQAKLPQGGYAVGRLHAIGRRSGQQDSFAVSDVEDISLCKDKGVMAIVADGMGGLADGDKVSSMVTLSLFRHFHERPIVGTAGDALLQMLKEANSEVNRFLGGKQGKCGSTLVAGIVKDRKCYWISVGDSHIYLYRGGSLMQLNREHVYGMDLDAKAANGEISREEALSDPQRGALTSYIGMGRLEKVDRNLTPLTLQAGDRLLFMTDGVFGTLSEQQMAEAMRYPVEQSVQLMGEAIRAVGKSNQDNYTAVILECR